MLIMAWDHKKRKPSSCSSSESSLSWEWETSTRFDSQDHLSCSGYGYSYGYGYGYGDAYLTPSTPLLPRDKSEDQGRDGSGALLLSPAEEKKHSSSAAEYPKQPVAVETVENNEEEDEYEEGREVGLGRLCLNNNSNRNNNNNNSSSSSVSISEEALSALTLAVAATSFSSKELLECKGAPGAKKPRTAATAVGLVVPGCQVDGCNADLAHAKDYHRRHKVCVAHSKAAVGTVGGLNQRFCQQCSRFHSLAEFDEGKRSCRKRLAGHNERRRKPQPDPLLMYSPFLKDGTQRLPFVTSSLWFSPEDEFKFNSESENWQGGGKSEGQFMINFSSESSSMVGGGGHQLFLPKFFSQKVNNSYDSKPLSNVFAPSQTILDRTNCHPPFSNCSRSSTLSFSGGAEMHSGSELPLLPSMTGASDIACALSLQHPSQASDVAKDWFPQPNNSNNNNSSTLDPSLLLLVHQNSQEGLIFPSESSSSSHSNNEGNFMHGQKGLRNPGICSFPPLQVEGMGGGGYEMNDIARDEGSLTLIDLMRFSSHLHSSETGGAFSLESSTIAPILHEIGGELQALHYEPTLFDSWPLI